MLDIPRLSVQELENQSDPKFIGDALVHPGLVTITSLNQAIFDALYGKAREFGWPEVDQSSISYRKNGKVGEWRLQYSEEWGVNDTVLESPQLQQALKNAHDYLKELSIKLQTPIKKYLGNKSVFDLKPGLLKLIRYGPTIVTRFDQRLEEHFDEECALLPSATQEGLEVLVNGEWHKIPIEPGTATLIPGKKLERNNAGRIKALKHRVENPPPIEQNAERYSINYAIYYINII